MRVREHSFLTFGVILPALSTAFSLPQFDFRLPFSWRPLSTPGAQSIITPTEVKAYPLRVAIVGAGAGGSSAAFWITKAKERHEQNVHVDVYEQSNYIGGRMSYCFPLFFGR
jgi:prenylcysteine oxidase/farnesylcysteine lyase